MKQKTVLTLITAVIISISGCTDIIQEQDQQGSELRQFTKEPVSITWNGDKKGGIQSFQANVEIYSKNSRRGSGTNLDETYHLAVRTIDDKIVTRMDYNNNQDNSFCSVISDSEEIIFFNYQPQGKLGVL